jgi:monoamine oxidase
VRQHGFTEVEAFTSVHHFDGAETYHATRSTARRRAYARVMRRIDQAAARGLDVAVSTVIGPADAYEHLAVNEIGPCTAGVDVEQLSTMDVGAKVREAYDGCGGARQDVMVREGLGTFVAEYGAGVPVELRTAVEGITWRPGSVVVSATRGTYRGRAVIVTVPAGVLARGQIAFAPRLPAWKARAFRDLPMARFKKMYIELEPRALERFPCSANVEDLTDSRMSFIVRPAGSTRLVLAMTGGALASRLDAGGDRLAIDYVLKRLGRLLGRRVEHRFVRAWVPRWDRDPWTGGGAYSAARPGRHAARHLARQPLEGSLYFAGEAYDDKWATYLPGAYRTGLLAAAQVLRDAFGGPGEDLNAA